MPLTYERFRLDRTVPTPFYYQIEQFLLQAIQTGELAVGERLPPELELMELFGVSRITVRQAIGDLVGQGVLIRRKGLGTFVQPPKVQESALQVLESFHEEMTKKGYSPQTRVLALHRVAGDADAGPRLGLSPDEPLWFLRRTRSVGGEAVLTFDTYLPAGRFPGLDEEDLERHSLYARLEERYGCRVDRVERHVSAAVANREEADRLGIERGTAVFRVTFVGWAGDLPVEYSRTTYRGDRVEFVVEVRR